MTLANVRARIARPGLVCVVPQEVAGVHGPADGARVAARRSAAIAQGFTFRLDERGHPIRRSRGGSGPVLGSWNDWLANENVVRGLRQRRHRPITQAARHRHDLDGSLVQIALT